MTPKFVALVPERIAFAHLADGFRYELWRTPQRAPGWTLYGYQDDVQISATPLESELRGRIEFERKVEAMSA